jgi:hypothetical protein
MSLPVRLVKVLPIFVSLFCSSMAQAGAQSDLALGTPIATVTSTPSMGARGEIVGERTTTVSASAAPKLVAAEYEEMNEQAEGRIAPRPDLSSAVGAQVARPDGNAPIRNLSAFAAPVTPQPTYSFNTSGAFLLAGIDVTAAASHTHICLTARNTFACYSKGGALTGLGNGFGPQPVLAKTFFESSGISPLISLPGNGSPTTPNGDFVKDGRILFDPITLRFYAVFQTREDAARLLIAVSKSEDPNDGWWTYAEPIGIGSQYGQDYQKIGVNGQFLLVSNRQMDRKTNVFSTFNWMFSLAELTSGQKFSKLMWTTGTDEGLTPCLHQTFTTDAYYLTEETTSGTVWIFRNGIIFRRSFTFKNAVVAPPDGEQLGSNTMVENHVGANPGNAEYRNGKIVWVSALGIGLAEFPFPKSPLVFRGAVRIGRIDVSNFSPFNAASPKLEIDEFIPPNDQGDVLSPWPNGLFHRAHPAVATNANGDIVVGSLKSNSTILAAQSASAWFSGQPQISAGAVIAKGLGPLSAIHMAGASSDPSTGGVYLAQQIGIAGGTTIQVTKMLGTALPDIVTTNMSAVVPTGGIRQGIFFTIMVTVTNQGDAIMPASSSDLYLSVSPAINPQFAIKLTSFKVPSLAINETQVVPVYVYISPDLGPLSGDWYVGPVLSSDHVADEQSYKNNLNPTLAANRGNLMITFPKAFADGDFELPVEMKSPWEFKFNNPLGQGGVAHQAGAYAGAQFAWLYNNNCKACDAAVVSPTAITQPGLDAWSDMSQVFSVAPGKTYTVTAYVQVHSTTLTIGVTDLQRSYLYDYQGTVSYKSYPELTGANGWQKVTFDFQSADRTSVRLYFGYDPPASSQVPPNDNSWVHVDQVSVIAH